MGSEVGFPLSGSLPKPAKAGTPTSCAKAKRLFCLVVNKMDVSRILRMGTWCAPEYAGERLVPVARNGGLSLLITQRRESREVEFVNGGVAEGYGEL